MHQICRSCSRLPRGRGGSVGRHIPPAHVRGATALPVAMRVAREMDTDRDYKLNGREFVAGMRMLCSAAEAVGEAGSLGLISRDNAK